MSANFYDMLKYAATGIASPSMTYFDRMKASTLMGGGKVQTLTGQPPLSFTSDGSPLISWSLLGNAQQTGTPSPDNIIMPDFCGVRTGNLFDRTAMDEDNGYESGIYLLQSGLTRSSAQYFISEYIAVKPETSYTLVYNSDRLNAPSVCFYDNSKQYINGESYSLRLPLSFTTPTGTAYIRFSGRLDYKSEIMLNEGMTAEDYEPYGYKIPFTCAGQTVPVYLGQTPTVRRIKKLVLTGEENIPNNDGTPYNSTFSTDRFVRDIDKATESNGTDNIIVCTHITFRAQVWTATTRTGCCIYCSRNTMQLHLRFDNETLGIEQTDTNEERTAKLKAYIANQYAAGHPVTIWYVLAEPETGIVNEPLAKIGDYADELHSTDAGVTIPTAKGNNTLTVDTDLPPSSVTIRYKSDE